MERDRQPMNAYPHSESKTAERKMYFIGCVLFKQGPSPMITNLDGSSNHRDMLTGEPTRAKHCSASIARAFLESRGRCRCRGPPTAFKPRYSVYGNHPGNLPYLHARYLGYLTRSTSCFNNRASSIILVSLMATVERLPLPTSLRNFRKFNPEPRD
jgi:hypothetical protein